MNIQMDDLGIITKLLGGAVTMLVAGISWLIKVIFVNNKKIAVLENRIDNDIERQKEMHERQKQLLDEIREVRSDVRQIHSQLYKN